MTQATKTSIPRRKPSVRKRKNTGNKRRWWIFLAAAFLCIGIAIGLAIPYFTGGANTDAIIKIPKNATLEMVEDSIEKYLGESFASEVSNVIKIEDCDLTSRYGAYKISQNMSAFRAARKLTRGSQSTIKITFVHARTLEELAQKISLKVDASQIDILNAMLNKEFLKSNNTNRQNVISLFMEDTYEAYWSDSAEKIVERISSYYYKFWNETRIQKAEKLNLSPSEIKIVASITDEESNKKDEKGKIGRLYINRLNKGMKLQADPTVKYAVGDFSIRRITGKHLKKVSPYNTYLNNGLPPGPIRTTSKQTVDAILNSKPSTDIFMCAKEDFSGYHNFASSHQEHMQNARRYQNALNQRGIK